MSVKPIVWSERALKEYEALLDYLLDEWNEQITMQVVDELEQSVLRIQNTPEQFPIILKSKKVHRCVMSPQTSIFFKVNKEAIDIISMFDNRQDPKKRKL